jgi:glycosyltransferase involved in cell wall biosynthesis
MKPVLIISDDILPRAERIGRAAGLRAWEIGMGLKENGIDVHFAVRTKWWDPEIELPLKGEKEEYWDSTSEIKRIIEDKDWATIVNCSFPSILPIEASEYLIIQDSHGPRMLEGVFRRPDRSLGMAWNEIGVYNSADYFICAGEHQLNYFYPWLALSGFNLMDTERIFAVRFGYSGIPPQKKNILKHIIYGGTLLPWADPRIAWRIALEEIEKSDYELLMITSAQDNDKSSRLLSEELETISKSKQCRVFKRMPRSQYLEELSNSIAALDVMEYNAERKLAFPTRTAEYLWAGIPPITYNYGEIGPLVREYNAGWVVPPRNEDQIRRAIREAISDPDSVREKSRGAQKLHNELLIPSRTTKILSEICKNGTKRKNRGRPITRERRWFGKNIATVLRMIYHLKGI